MLWHLLLIYVICPVVTTFRIHTPPSSTLLPTTPVATIATGPTVYGHSLLMSSTGSSLLLLLLLSDPDTDNSSNVATSAFISRIISSIIIHPLSLHDDRIHILNLFL